MKFMLCVGIQPQKLIFNIAMKNENAGNSL